MPSDQTTTQVDRFTRKHVGRFPWILTGSEADKIAERKIRPLIAALIEIDQMASQRIEHGVGRSCEFTRRVFDVCEGALIPERKANE